jgi:orotidine-5'-phosphate decarboxylase
MNPELIVALDVPSKEQIPAIVEQLPAEILYYKVGLELFVSEGPAALEYLLTNDKKVFLDLKLHDIPRTVANAVTTAAKHGVDMLTVHGIGGRAMLTAAAEAAAAQGDKAPRLLAITTLTSLDEKDFKELGINRDISEQAVILGGIALKSGIDGLVTSAHELESLRETFGDDPLLVTPGIRPADGEKADQKRIATPEAAVRAGASFLVVGRPILQANNPGQAAQTILDQMKTG